MQHTIGRRVMARYQRHLDQGVTEQLWDDMVYELPQGIRRLFDRPKEDSKDTRDLSMHSFEKEVQLDGKDVGLFLKVSYTVEDDSDGESIYGTELKRMSFWFTADPWEEDGKDEVSGYGDLDLSAYKRLIHAWVDKVKELYPEVAERYNLR